MHTYLTTTVQLSPPSSPSHNSPLFFFTHHYPIPSSDTSHHHHVLFSNFSLCYHNFVAISDTIWSSFVCLGAHLEGMIPFKLNHQWLLLISLNLQWDDTKCLFSSVIVCDYIGNSNSIFAAFFYFYTFIISINCILFRLGKLGWGWGWRGDVLIELQVLVLLGLIWSTCIADIWSVLNYFLAW